jgi:RND family efflux transporter MFP subunit
LNRSALLSLGILLFAGIVVWALVLTRPEAVPEPPEIRAPVVRALRVEPQELALVVQAQGTVAPRTESEIVSQVSGEVLWISPALVSGGFFEEKEPLLRIDPIDYEAALETARATLARAKSEANRALKERDRQRRLAKQSVASQARIDDAENAYRVAAAMERDATARVGIAERDLARTEIRAPYAGRVRSENVDRGQFVVRGESVARVYAVDFAEVRLPIPDRELRYMELLLGYREKLVSDSETATGSGEAITEGALTHAVAPVFEPRVTFQAEFAGALHTWEGKIVRTEGELDPKSRMVTLVARVADPYGRTSDRTRPPLAVGLFVEAAIEGLGLEDAFVLPRSALKEGSRVMVIDAEERAYFRAVDVLREERDRVVITGGLRAGDLVCVSPLPGAVDGMRVRVSEAREDDLEVTL